MIGTREWLDRTHGALSRRERLAHQAEAIAVLTADLSSRLREQIARPLHRIAEVRMPQLAAELKLVEEHVADAATAAGELATATTTADEILVEMRQVLDRMLELETYNEVVALLRGIITDQDDLNRRTKERKTERIRSLFE